MKNYFSFLLNIFISISIIIGPASAQIIPNSADVGRIGLEKKQELPTPPKESAPQPQMPVKSAKAPQNAKNIEFTLNDIDIQGATVFKDKDLKPLYEQYLGKKITLDTIWQICDAITALYQNKGYFLSRATVPAQEISKSGVFVIKIVEGYVEVVELDDPIADNYIVKSLVKKLKQEKPLNIKTLESITLRLNDINGLAFRSVLEPLKDADSNEGGIKVILVKETKRISGSLTFDNYNSMFLGPYQGLLNLEFSALPQNQTSLTWLNSMPWNRLKYFSGNHNVQITSSISVDIYGGYTDSRPGYTLFSSNIESDSFSMGTSINFQPIKQRLENLTFKTKLESKDVASDVLRTPLTRDHIRVARLNIAYDRTDFLSGYDFLNVTISQGLTEFDASKKGDSNLSRTGVDPKFRKLEITLNRFQSVGNWTQVTSVSGQLANGPQYSSEQIGYGGQSYGRAYDPSDIVGDTGILGALELRYNGLPSLRNINFSPYVFYDVGKVSSNSIGESRSSTGTGLRFDSGKSFFGNITIAQPLVHKVTTPPYGNGKNPRLFAQIGFRF